VRRPFLDVKVWALILWDLRPCLHPLYCKLLRGR
jgi:hypothetical protein